MKARDILSKPEGVLALLVSALYIVLAVVYFSTDGYFSRSPDSAFASADYRPGEVVLDPTNIASSQGRKTAPVDLKKAVMPTPQAIEKGRALFSANCAPCHGQDGKGDGPAAKGLSPAPRNFTSPDKWVNGYDLADIFRTVTEGVKGTAMGAYDTLSAQDRFDLAHYVQSLGAFPHGTVGDAELAKLDEQFHLSEGTREPNRAPVSRVMANMAAEYGAGGGTLLDAARLGASERRVYDRAVLDPGAAARTLEQLGGWRGHPSVLAEGVSSGTPGNGFSPAVGTFSDREWGLLHDALVKLAPKGPKGSSGAQT